MQTRRSVKLRRVLLHTTGAAGGFKKFSLCPAPFTQGGFGCAYKDVANCDGRDYGYRF